MGEEDRKQDDKEYVSKSVTPEGNPVEELRGSAEHPQSYPSHKAQTLGHLSHSLSTVGQSCFRILALEHF